MISSKQSRRRFLILEALEQRMLLAANAANDLLPTETTQSPYHPRGALLVVDTLVDESDGNFSAGDLSLREAVELSNASPGVMNSIQFSPALHRGTISLEYAATGQTALQVTDSVDIQGPGWELLVIDASGGDPTPGVANGDGLRAFGIDPGISVNIQGLTITGGDVSGSGGAIHSLAQLNIREVLITGNTSLRGGGLANLGNATVDNSRFTDNRATLGGGGIQNFRAELQVTDSTIAENGSLTAGGGILDEGGTTTIQASVITGNYAGWRGGGIGQEGSVQYDYYYNPYTQMGYFYYTAYESTTSVSQSTIADNQSDRVGGGFYAGQGSNTSIFESTISGNRTADDGGGVYLFRDQSYPFYVGGNAAVTNSTISGNAAGNRGGGLFDVAVATVGDFRVEYTTITDNIADADQNGTGRGGGLGGIGFHGPVLNTIVSGNTNNAAGGLNADLYNTHAGGFLFSVSLIGDNAGTSLTEAPVGAPDGNGNLIGGPIFGTIDARLAPLTNNGGTTESHVPFASSPAVNAGGLFPNGPTNDQRGAPFQRVLGSAPDMGAFEIQYPSPISGDFDGNGFYECADIDRLVTNIAIGPPDPATYDLNSDGAVTFQDVEAWLAEAGADNLTSGDPYLKGDINLDGIVDASDFDIWNVHKFTLMPRWCSGDLNADGAVDGSDFSIWNQFKSQTAGRSDLPNRPEKAEQSLESAIQIRQLPEQMPPALTKIAPSQKLGATAIREDADERQTKDDRPLHVVAIDAFWFSQQG